MAYLVLARKHRPQSFDDIIGQEAVATTLANALSSKRLSHAYLFFGSRGVGKTTAARVLAKALNCAKGPTPSPCGRCPACEEIATGRSIDVLEMDAASNTSVENVRQAIIDTVALAPSRDRYKIFIIDEAHMLSNAAFNALLKTMEEPPGHVVFILATTEPHKIPATIFSRCQRFRFRPLPAATIAERLRAVAAAEKAEIEPGAIELLSRAAAGSMRDGLSLMDQALSFSGGALTAASTAELLGLLPRELVAGLVKAIAESDRKALWDVLQSIAKEGYEPVQILKDLRDALEAAYLDRLGVLPSEDARLAPLAGRSAEGLAGMLKRLQGSLDEMRSTDAPRLTLELGLFGLLDVHDLGAWVERLESLESRLANGETAAERPTASALRKPSPQAPSQPSPTRGEGANSNPTELSRPEAAPPSSPSAPSDIDPMRAFKAVVRKLQAEEPALAGYLGQARAAIAPGGLTLYFQTAFHRGGAQRADARLKEMLRVEAGGEVRLTYEVDATPAPPEPPDETEEDEDAGAAPAPQPAVQGEWTDLSTGDPLAEDDGINKILKVFPGKLRRPKDGDGKQP